MKSNYDLKNMKRREGPVKVDPEAGRIAISIKVDASDLGDIRVEAQRRGIPYQTLINSILHMFVTGELVDRKESVRVHSKSV
jgi:predicted DNA binding CopG/RHH family protein